MGATRLRTGLVLATAIAAVMLGAPAAGGAASVPRLLSYSYSDNIFSVRPAYMEFTSPVVGVPTMFITVRGLSRSAWRRDRLGHIDWTRWGSVATAVGEQWEDDCSPNCDHGYWVPMRIWVRAWRVRHGRFTRLSLLLRPRGLPPLHSVYDLDRSRQGFLFWGTRTTAAD